MLAMRDMYAHTHQFQGLGDNDITLTKSSPAHMQPIIKAFPNTTFVLLHSGYPYTREAGYLAAMYKNVYLDFGEIFPMVSADGQRAVIKQMLELTPTNKLLWSSRVASENIHICADRTLPSGRSLVARIILSSQHPVTAGFIRGNAKPAGESMAQV